MIPKCRLFIGLGEQGTAKMWQKLTDDLAEEGFVWNWISIPEDQYETVVQTQIAAGLTCDIVDINGSTSNKGQWL